MSRWTIRALLKQPARSSEYSLALLRIAVAILVLISSNEVEIARVVAARPIALLHHPEGLGWLGTTTLPITPRAISIAYRVLQASAVLSLLGIWTRVSLSVLAVSLLYVFGAAQLTGTVLHDMHLFWFAVLLAITRGGPSRLSLSTWAASASSSPPPPVVDHTFTLAIARLWLGLVYFFPGFHKIIHGGGAWLSGETLRGQLYFKWYEAGAPPWGPRIDRVPALLTIGSIFVVAVELAMPFLLLRSNRTRMIALGLAMVFHFASGHFLDVLFPSLIGCWVIALPLSPPDEKVRLEKRVSPLTVVAALFTIAIVIQGARGQMQSYPFACYPTFADPAPSAIIDLAVDVDGDAGRFSFRLPRQRRQDEWGFVWRLAGLYGDPIDPDRLRAFATTIVPKETLARSSKVHIMREAYDITPDRYGAPPIERSLLLTYTDF